MSDGTQGTGHIVSTSAVEELLKEALVSAEEAERNADLAEAAADLFQGSSPIAAMLEKTTEDPPNGVFAHMVQANQRTAIAHSRPQEALHRIRS